MRRTETFDPKTGWMAFPEKASNERVKQAHGWEGEVIFTSGASEAAALAHLRLAEILIARGRQRPAIEHLHGVLDLQRPGSELHRHAQAMLRSLEGGR